MKQATWIWTGVAALVATVGWAQEPGQREPSRLERQVLAFAASDRANPPPASPILLVGSSSFTRWRSAARDLDNPDVLNRGFGGSQMAHVLRWFDHVVQPYDPRQILVYEGVDVVDTWTPMLDDQNLPREDLFIGDRLHLSQKGYEVWSGLLQPLLRPRPEPPSGE